MGTIQQYVTSPHIVYSYIVGVWVGSVIQVRCAC